MPAHHDVRATDVNAKRLGAVLAVAYERDLRDFASFLLLEQLGPRTLQSLALIAEVVHGAPATVRRSRAVLVRAWRQGRSSISRAPAGLRRVDLRAATRARRAKARAVGEDAGHVTARRVHAVDRATRSTGRGRRSGDRPRARDSPRLGGRTVFDDRARTPVAARFRRPTRPLPSRTSPRAPLDGFSPAGRRLHGARDVCAKSLETAHFS